MNQFYITLPSNSVDAKNPYRTAAPSSNSQSDFRVYLPFRYTSDGEWEVALSEIICTHSWSNINRDEDKDRYIIYTDVKAKAPSVCSVEPGNYETPQVLATAVNDAIDRCSIKHGVDRCIEIYINGEKIKWRTFGGCSRLRKCWTDQSVGWNIFWERHSAYQRSDCIRRQMDCTPIEPSLKQS